MVAIPTNMKPLSPNSSSGTEMTCYSPLAESFRLSPYAVIFVFSEWKKCCLHSNLFESDIHYNQDSRSFVFKTWDTNPKLSAYSFLFSPSVCTMCIGANIIQSHLLFSSPCLCLEEYSLSMIALWARMILTPRQGGIRDHIWHNMCQFINFMHNFVDINATAVS